jgi:hypothetical protein
MNKYNPSSVNDVKQVKLDPKIRMLRDIELNHIGHCSTTTNFHSIFLTEVKLATCIIF